MVRIIGSLATVLLLSMPAPTLAEDSLKDIAYKMAVISRVSYSEMERTENRYRYVLPQFVEICIDVDKPQKAGDMLVTVRNLVIDTGMEEGLLPLVETLYSLTQDVAVYSKVANVPLRCGEIWAMYAALREKGRTPKAASYQVVAVIRMLYGI